MAVDENGYLYAFEVYTGKKGNNGKTCTGLGTKVVLAMRNQFPANKPFIFCADNFFSSAPLVEDLTNKKTFYVGTVKLRRK